MKRITLLLLACLFVVACFGQKSKRKPASDDVYYMKISEQRELTTPDDISYMRKCLANYHKVRQTGALFSVASVISAGAYVLGEGEKPELLVVSGTLGLCSYISYLTAEKWLKRASLKPADAGFGVKFEF